jgi:hypothetical protein
MPRHHLTYASKARHRALLVHQKHRVDHTRCVVHRDNKIMRARTTRQPGMRRGVLMQHHSHHRTARPLLAVRRALRRRLHQARPTQMQLRHRVAQPVVVPLAQLLLEMLHREAAIQLAIQTQHPLDLRHRRTAQRRTQPAIGQTRLPCLAVAVTPAAERALADPKQLSRLHLAQLRPLRAAKNIRETHPTYPLVNACPVHACLHSWRPTEPDTSRATKPGQTTS